LVENLTVIGVEEDSIQFQWKDDSFCYGGFKAKIVSSYDGRALFRENFQKSKKI